MTLEISLPFGKKDNVKDIVFSILSKEYPLRIIDLMNFIKKRYGKSVTFQAVRKAVFELKEEGILMQEDRKFFINEGWVLESKKKLDDLYIELKKDKSRPKSFDSMGGEISVFEFDSLNKLMIFWEELIDDWFRKLKNGDSKVNCYQASHAWEVLLHPEEERKIMGQLKKKGVKSYLLCTSNTPLDKAIKNFYDKINVKLVLDYSKSSFDRGYYVGTYGDLVIQTQYPVELVVELDDFFKKNKKISDLDIGKLSEIVNKKRKMKLTIIRNKEMAKQINQSILDRLK